MKTRMLFCGLLLTLLAANAAVPAFPGAEGHGRYVTGGRGGVVCFVNSLDDDPQNPKNGTLRYAINRTEARTIVFTVSGTIFLKGPLNISNGNLTIAGQTAPGDGICIAGYPVSVSANNVIIRFLRIRMGDGDATNSDGADALGGRGLKNVIIDHCSCSWSTDECVSFYGNENFTMQWCIVSESLRYSTHSKGGHGYGGIWGGCNASFHHNLLIHHSSRTPRLGSEATTVGREVVDLRNNVIYNYGAVVGAYGAEGMDANIVNCYYKPGPSTGGRRAMIFGISPNETDDRRPRWGRYFIDGNVVNSLNDIDRTPTNTDERYATNNNWQYGIYKYMSSASSAEKQAMRLSEPLATGLITTHSAKVAYDKVLNTAGCSLVRDEIDQRLERETRTGTATFKGNKSQVGGIIDTPTDLKPAGAGEDWSPWPTLNGTEAPIDTDRDGMPDEWELAHGLNPKYPLDRREVAENGYTNLENYLNSLVEHIVKAELSDFESIESSESNDFYTAISLPSVETTRCLLDGHSLSIESAKPIATFSLYDLAGRPLISQHKIDGQSCELELPELANGVYLCVLQGPTGREVIKLKKTNQ